METAEFLAHLRSAHAKIGNLLADPAAGTGVTQQLSLTGSEFRAYLMFVHHLLENSPEGKAAIERARTTTAQLDGPARIRRPRPRRP